MSQRDLSETTPITFGLVIALISPVIVLLLWIASIQGTAQANYTRNEQRIQSVETMARKQADFMYDQAKLLTDANTRLARIEEKLDFIKYKMGR